MEANSPALLIEQARVALGQSRDLLAKASPENLDASGIYLEGAARLFGDALAALADHPQPPGAHGAVTAALGLFRRELAQVEALHAHAAGLHLGWMRAFAELAGADYAPPGERAWPALRPRGRRVSVEA